jgi:3-hydroxyisobutyrate dehydrogenase-like beta-hydroxyacid dehydrogenase
MAHDLTLIGFGEAGSCFAIAGGWGARARVYDRLTDAAATRRAKQEDYARAGVAGVESLAEAVEEAGLIISVVTADQALAVAEAGARSLPPGAFFCDMNSAAPATKRKAAAAIEAASAHYIDVAVMAPVDPCRLAVPLLASGARGGEAAALLAALGFTDVHMVGAEVGRASTIKMIRSVIVKGIEALTAECSLAAEAAGVRDEVFASLDASWRTQGWEDRAGYNLERMLRHGRRRAAEMEEVVKTLDDLGTGSAMSRAASERQREIGELGLAGSAALADCLVALRGGRKDRAA